MRHSYAVDMSKSLSSSLTRGFVARASSNAIRIIAMRPRSRARRVMPFIRSSLVNTGMMTTSLMASQVSTTPVKSVTSRRIRARCTCSISSVGRSRSQSAVTVCQTRGWPLTCTPWSVNHCAVRSRRAVSGLPRSGSKPPQ